CAKPSLLSFGKLSTDDVANYGANLDVAVTVTPLPLNVENSKNCRDSFRLRRVSGNFKEIDNLLLFLLGQIHFRDLLLDIALDKGYFFLISMLVENRTYHRRRAKWRH